MKVNISFELNNRWANSTMKFWNKIGAKLTWKKYIANQIKILLPVSNLKVDIL